MSKSSDNSLAGDNTLMNFSNPNFFRRMIILSIALFVGAQINIFSELPFLWRILYTKFTNSKVFPEPGGPITKDK